MDKQMLINRDKIRGIMAEKRLTQEDVSDYLGISRASFNYKRSIEEMRTNRRRNKYKRKRK
jgi:transcriptional regulator with XRE-family HTH domain